MSTAAEDGPDHDNEFSLRSHTACFDFRVQTARRYKKLITLAHDRCSLKMALFFGLAQKGEADAASLLIAELLVGINHHCTFVLHGRQVKIGFQGGRQNLQ